MPAYQLGPLVLSAPRFYALLGVVALVLAAEVVSWRDRRGRRRAGAEGVSEETASAAWAWNAALAVFVGARLGFVIENIGAFLDRPLAIVQFWQGGFSPWWGVAAGALVAMWSVLRRGVRISGVVIPAMLALAVWLVVPALLTPAQLKERSLPSLVLERLEGGDLNLASLSGRPVVINLWATWCPPCRRELPMLAEATGTYPDVRFVFANQGEGRETVQRYLDQRETLVLEGVVLDTSGRLATQFSTVGLPTTLFFDATGAHVLTHAGELSSVMLGNYLKDLGRFDQRSRALPGL